MKEFKIEKRTITGTFVILVGAILLLSSTGIIGKGLSLGTFWPVILIVLGIVRIINFDESTTMGFIFLISGIYFQLRNLNVTFLEEFRIGQIFWPVIIIAFGVSLILPEILKKKIKD